MEQRSSCASLLPGLCLIIGGAIGWFRGDWVGALIGAPAGLGAGLLAILLLGLTTLALNRTARKHRPPVD